MPAGRKQVDYSEIGYDAITVKVDNSTILFDAAQPGGSPQVGLAVTWSADDTVALTADGDFVLGKLLKVNADLFATVQHEGFVALPAGNGATTTRGKQVVGALGASSAKGYIREVNTATAAELGKQNGRIHNVAVSTAVVIEL